MQGVAQSPLAIRASVTRAAVKGRFSWNRSANVFDLELPGVKGSERRGFVVFMQKQYRSINLFMLGPVWYSTISVDGLIQTTRFGHP